MDFKYYIYIHITAIGGEPVCTAGIRVYSAFANVFESPRIVYFTVCGRPLTYNGKITSDKLNTNIYRYMGIWMICILL